MRDDDGILISNFCINWIKIEVDFVLNFLSGKKIMRIFQKESYKRSRYARECGRYREF